MSAPSQPRYAVQHNKLPKEAITGWDDLKSKGGNEYRVKALDYDISTEGDGKTPDAKGPSFKDVAVYWTVGTSGAPSIDVQNKTAITWYKLDYAEWWSPYKYKLSINTLDTYDYYFTDQSPDSYQLNVYQNAGTHEVEYRSDKPAIVSISGS